MDGKRRFCSSGWTGGSRSSEGRMHTNHTPPRLIDVGEAFEALKLSAQDLATTGSVRGREAGDCTPLLDSAMARIGLTPDTLPTAPVFAEPGHPRRTLPADTTPGLTLGAMLVLRAAERAERRGAEPLAAVRHAHAVLLKYVSVLPASLFPPASRARPDRRKAR